MKYLPLFISGHPRPKGSWTAVQTRSGIKFRPASDKTAKWCQHLTEELRERWTHTIILDGPVRCTLKFLLPRPKTVMRQRPTGRFEGDLDKHVRAVLDSMTNIVYKDDSQVVEIHTTKHYTDGECGVWIEVDTDNL